MWLMLVEGRPQVRTNFENPSCRLTMLFLLRLIDDNYTARRIKNVEVVSLINHAEICQLLSSCDLDVRLATSLDKGGYSPGLICYVKDLLVPRLGSIMLLSRSASSTSRLGHSLLSCSFLKVFTFVEVIPALEELATRCRALSNSHLTRENALQSSKPPVQQKQHVHHQKRSEYCSIFSSKGLSECMLGILNQHLRTIAAGGHLQLFPVLQEKKLHGC